MFLVLIIALLSTINSFFYLLLTLTLFPKREAVAAEKLLGLNLRA